VLLQTQVAEADEDEVEEEEERKYGAVHQLIDKSIGRTVRAVATGSALKFRKKGISYCYLHH
jgi:hypothetical protein